MTLRPMKNQPPDGFRFVQMNEFKKDVAVFERNGPMVFEKHGWSTCPYGQPGDRLWVPEKYRIVRAEIESFSLTVEYPDGEQRTFKLAESDYARWYSRKRPWAWTSSRFMPKWAARTWLDFTSVRVERIQEITDSDARAEGMVVRMDAVFAGAIAQEPPLVMEFWDGWHKQYPGSWDRNEWVWVIEFKRVKP